MRISVNVHGIVKYLLVSLFLSTSFFASAKEDVRVPENRVIYEVFVRNFSPAGNLKGVKNQVQRLKDLGVDVIWLMPIYTPGETDRWGSFASPYAVKNYKGIDPFYGNQEDLHNLVNAVHDAGMEIWLDWVANHTSTDHAWITEHPEFYVWENGSPKHPNGWNDVYQLNYSNEGLRSAMIDALKYWVIEFDIDGYRCDYADGVPRDFWKRARNEVNTIKDIAWMAESAGEGNNALLVTETFDYNYAWAYNDKLIEVGTGNDASKVANESRKLYYGNDAYRYEGKSRMVYLSNHDVVQDKGGTEDRHFGANLKPMTVLEFTIYGMPLIYNGQEIKNSSGTVLLAERTPINWNSGDASVTELIKNLCALKHTEPALRTGVERGDLINYETDKSSVYVYERRRDNHSVVVMLNFGDNPATFTVTTPLPKNEYHDFFTETRADFTTTNTFTLPAHGYAVYVKDDEDELVTNDVTIKFYRPSYWKNIPNVHVYRHNATTDRDEDLITNTPMSQVAGKEGVFEKKLLNAPDGYFVMFNNGGWSNGQSVDSYFEPEAGNFAYTLDDNKRVIRYNEDSLLPELTIDESDNDTPIIYDLNGRVSNASQRGVYIMKRGNRVSKIFK